MGFWDFLTNIFGSRNERVVETLTPTLEQVKDWETKFSSYSDSQLREMTNKFRYRLLNNETVDEILPEVFAVVRIAAKRVLGMYPFDVQVLGAIVLHQGKIAEMKTGEGKTLVSTMPAYLNALIPSPEWINAARERMETDLWNGSFYRAYASPGNPSNENSHGGTLAGEIFSRLLVGKDVLSKERLYACADAIVTTPVV